MNQINRYEEEAWTPQWDLGLQDSFGFMDTKEVEPKKEEKRSPGWSFATKEVLNRQTATNRRIDAGPNSIAALIAFFESEFVEEGASNE